MTSITPQSHHGLCNATPKPIANKFTGSMNSKHLNLFVLLLLLFLGSYFLRSFLQSLFVGSRTPCVLSPVCTLDYRPSFLQQPYLSPSSSCPFVHEQGRSFLQIFLPCFVSSASLSGSCTSCSHPCCLHVVQLHSLLKRVQIPLVAAKRQLQQGHSKSSETQFPRRQNN